MSQSTEGRPPVSALSYEEFQRAYPPMMGADGEAENPPEGTQGAPDPGTSATGGEPPEFFADRFDPSSLEEPLQRQYGLMRADYTRKTQELAEQRRAIEQQQTEAQQAAQLLQALQSDADTQQQTFRWLAEQLGYQVDDPTQGEDPVAALEARLAQLEGARQAEQQQQSEQQRIQADIDAIDQAVEAIQRQEGRELSQNELELLASFAVNSRNQDGTPNVAAGYERMKAAQGDWQQSWLQSKRAPAAPGAGLPGQEKFDPRNPEHRQARMKAMIEAEELAGS